MPAAGAHHSRTSDSPVPAHGRGARSKGILSPDQAAPSRILKLGVLVSGRGSNLQAILDCIEAGSLPARVVAVASNRPSAPALERARQFDISTASFPQGKFASKEERDRAMGDFLDLHGAQLIVLAGYDRLLAPAFIARYHHRMINVHPSLAPAFVGSLHAQADALRHGVKIAGCTVHFVTDEVDLGPIIVQRAVPVFDDDTEETLAARILDQEHQALPEAIRLIAEGRVTIEGNRTRII